MRYIVQKAEGISGPQIPESEPCLVIRGQDILAIPMLKTYLAFYKTHEGYDKMVEDDLLRDLYNLQFWQNENHDKVKWADR